MKYRKKPVVVEAVQYLLCENKNGTKNNNIVKLAKYNKKQKQKKSIWFHQYGTSYWKDNDRVRYDAFQVIVRTSRGEEIVSDGDYIIKNENGEIYTCKPDIFHKTYEKVKE